MMERIEKFERNETAHGVNLISMAVATHGANAITMVAFGNLHFQICSFHGIAVW